MHRRALTSSMRLVSYSALSANKLTISCDAATRSASGVLRANCASSLVTRERSAARSRCRRPSVSCGSIKLYAGMNSRIVPLSASSRRVMQADASCCSRATSITKFVSTKTFTQRGPQRRVHSLPRRTTPFQRGHELRLVLSAAKRAVTDRAAMRQRRTRRCARTNRTVRNWIFEDNPQKDVQHPRSRLARERMPGKDLSRDRVSQA